MTSQSPPGSDITWSRQQNEDQATTSSADTVVQSQGVTRMEAIYRSTKTYKKGLWLVGGSVLVCAWAYSLDFATTQHYSVDVSSYYRQHSTVLSILGIVTSILSAVSKPFIAKVSDITSRPYTYVVALAFYVVGYVVAATSQSISAYVVGEAFVALGSSGIDLVNDIIVADLTPLEWRGFLGALLSTPFIINTWFAGKIVQAMLSRNQWRWGYGMFAIIMPAAVCPAIATLIYLDRKAKKAGTVSLASGSESQRIDKGAANQIGRAEIKVDTATMAMPESSWIKKLRRGLIEIDAFGLLLLGLGWTLFLLPFSLKTYAQNGWANPSLIAMFVVGGVLLIAYVIYEVKWAAMPSAPKRLMLNKTFIVCVIIEASYFGRSNSTSDTIPPTLNGGMTDAQFSVSASMRGLYWSSYVYITKPWSYQNWVYYNNSLTLALCVFSPLAGALQRWTHRYKTICIIGLCIKVLGMGIMLNGHKATVSTGALVMTQLLIGGGGSMAVVGTRVASQASVPHQDVALTISLLALWSRVGMAIGSAIASVVWANQMPKQLRKYLPARASDKDVKTLFNNIRKLRTAYDFDSDMKKGAIEAYQNALYYLLAPALGLAFVPLVAAFFMSNFYLGKQQNAVTNVGVDGLPLAEKDNNPDPRQASKSFKETIVGFWKTQGNER
ncbi:Major facilitator superfamily domain, general substrate transporter [Metarhizium album ARSEF 1941]|uniref:Major facilitator superfamily domain, general substrate transporter n=1 Tax=Metarhizium album (strain ARSEF 1941) TaxID=1081103 RepID=A0A0B2WX69_METAS|nr:Major facilitator superfamily domain, general substrate transporter [Metarhizium album ARSEF 1941]KHN98027.1 Major facilitator superfamily domain, general substrate transporter [Metarhizium album ARSEF 1941]